MILRDVSAGMSDAHIYRHVDRGEITLIWAISIPPRGLAQMHPSCEGLIYQA